MKTIDAISTHLELLLPDTAIHWKSDHEVIQRLIQDDELRRSFVEGLEGWLLEIPFNRVILQHTCLNVPLTYEVGEGDQAFFHRLRMREREYDLGTGGFLGSFIRIAY